MNGKEILYNAFKSKDARLDGKFFVGVSSTGIYCDESGWRYRCFLQTDAGIKKYAGKQNYKRSGNVQTMEKLCNDRAV